MSLNIASLTTSTDLSPKSGQEVAAAYVAAFSKLKTAQAELEILKQTLVDSTHDTWVKASRNESTASIRYEEVDGKDLLVGRRRKTTIFKAVPSEIERSFEQTFKVTIDGSKVSPAKRQQAIDALSAAGIPAKAIKAEAGFKAKDGVLTDALATNDTEAIEFALGCYINTITVK